MNGRGKFVKVYYEVLTDEKFDGIRDDMAAMGSWLTLLIAAEKAWPDPALIPVLVPRAMFARLAACGLVDPEGQARYRIHGLDSERARRKARTEAAGGHRWGHGKDSAT